MELQVLGFLPERERKQGQAQGKDSRWDKGSYDVRIHMENCFFFFLQIHQVSLRIKILCFGNQILEK